MDENSTDPVEEILKEENRFVQQITVTKISGLCPYGHREGDRFMVTAMNSDGLCGSLLNNIFPYVLSQHYDGEVIWEKQHGSFTACCPEDGIVQVTAVQKVNSPPNLIKTKSPYRNMKGKGYPLIDNYRLYLEVLDIAGDCYWGHKLGDILEVDPFNVGGVCALLYDRLYPFIHLLLSGATPPWAGEKHRIMAECPDNYNRLSFSLRRTERT